MNETHNRLVNGIREYFKKAGIKKAVIGLSGGVDSAVSLKLVSEAIGEDNITALIMPERGLTKKENVEDAEDMCKLIHVAYKIIDINPILEQFKKIGMNQTEDSWINLKPRIRAVILYDYANANNALVIGTSNKTELMLGYFTKYGDGAVDIEVIGELYKTEVWELARHLGLPSRIITKTPSAELYKGQTDEGQIGESYKDIDAMLQGKKNMSKRIKELIQKNKHKTELPPVIESR